MEIDRSKSGIEQRNSLRWPADFKLGYGSGEEISIGGAVNISESGLSFRGLRLYPPGAQLTLSLELPGHKNEILKLKACVRRQDPDGLHGVEFLGVTSSQKTSILEIIYHLIAIRRQ